MNTLYRPERRLACWNVLSQLKSLASLFFYSYPVALSMIASGQVDVKPLITHRFKLEESLEAFEVSRTGAGGAIKVMIDCAAAKPE